MLKGKVMQIAGQVAVKQAAKWTAVAIGAVGLGYGGWKLSKRFRSKSTPKDPSPAPSPAPPPVEESTIFDQVEHDLKTMETTSMKPETLLRAQEFAERGVCLAIDELVKKPNGTLRLDILVAAGAKDINLSEMTLAAKRDLVIASWRRDMRGCLNAMKVVADDETDFTDKGPEDLNILF